MSAEPSLPASIDTLVASATSEVSRVISDLARQLEAMFAQQRDEAVATARREADDALRAAQEAADQGLARAIEDTECRLREEFDSRQRAAALEVETRAQERAAEQARAGLAELEQRAQAATEQAVRDAEARLRTETEAALQAVRDAAEARIASLMRLAQQSGERAAEEVHRGADEREGRLAASERLLRAVERLDEASSLRGVLDALADAIAAEAPRSLLLLVRDDVLRGWRATGIDQAPSDLGSFSVPLPSAGALGRAVTTATTVVAHVNAMDRETGGAFGFLQLAEDQAGLAVPVIVDGKPVAVVYADDGGLGDREVPASWPETVQVLVRHSGRCLEALTARRAVALRRVPSAAGRAVGAVPRETVATGQPADAESARRFARLLVSELKLYNEPLVEAGRQARDLRTRLAAQIARARRQYEERVPATLPGRADYFEQELVRTLADGDPSLLGGAGLGLASA